MTASVTKIHFRDPNSYRKWFPLW